MAANVPSKDKQLRRWCFTVKATGLTPERLIAILKEIGVNKYAFQKEEGQQRPAASGSSAEDAKSGGYIHYQGRVSFKQAKRLPNLKHPDIKPHWSIEANEQASSFYVLKEDTRVEGPWTDKDTVPYIPFRLRVGEDRLRGWQQWILARVRAQGDRKITFVVDKKGGRGKSFLGLWIATHGGVRLPTSLTHVQDFIQAAMATLGGTPSRSKIVVLDVPRSCVGVEKWFKFLTALEDIKNGHLCDPRYAYKEAFIEPPQLLVFSNTYPPVECLTGDRFDCVDILWAMFSCGDLSRDEYDAERAAQRAASKKVKVTADIEEEDDAGGVSSAAYGASEPEEAGEDEDLEEEEPDQDVEED